MVKPTELLKKGVLLLTFPIRSILGSLNRAAIKAIYHKEKTLKHDIKSDLRATMLNGLHQTLVGGLPQPFLIHNKQLKFNSEGGLMSVQAYYVGEVEYHQMSYLIETHLSANMIFLDVGGHHGAFATIVGYELKKKNLGGKVYTFEPDPRNISFIQKNLAENDLEKNVEIVAKAVSNQNGKGRFITSTDNSCNWLELGIETAAELSSTEIVEMVSLDVFCENFDRIDVIKIDIQGGELNALKGAENVIKKYRPILFVEIMDYSKDAKDAKSYLHELGYTLHYLTKKSQLVAADSPDIFISWDVVAIPSY
jgi:FkbM family methyltransferase